ncbi:GNAT family N-acetyltransferase [Skermania sp. ID1734]|uniref:GNAT family N-acetyltransferase n=1 Tax=Skermania sp. ID1734 TaxID=2597516 RepID=UPI00117C597B|nr:GNAT family N-acetyltransferase [Skermania sp. ID1734]TSD97321.1 GNAT family N-acetyltransferase [Skermania sp. ID1734]
MIRRATPADVTAIVGLVEELAEYEKARDLCHVRAEQLRAALFGPEPKVFAHVVDIAGEVVGTAIWFLNFSTWDGLHGIYLEDLYVKPAFRGAGYGTALLRVLAQECVERGYSRLSWSVLDWNTPSIAFYESLGAQPQDEWTGYRLSGAELRKLGSR